MRHFILLLPLPFAVSACTPDEAGDSGSKGGDTGSNDTGTNDTGSDDTDTAVDSGDGAATLTLNYDSDASGLGFALVGPHNGTTFPTELWSEQAASGTTQTIELAAPPESAISNVSMLGGASGAVYFLALFDDTNGSGARDAGEAWVSGGPLGVYFADSVPESLAAQGMTVGWNMVGYPTPSIYSMGAVPMTVHRPHYDITLGITLQGGPDGADMGMLLQGQVDVPPAAPLYDEPIDGNGWSINLSGAPEADHRLDPATDFVVAQPVAYIDRAPAGYGDGDSGYSYVCGSGGPVYLYWYTSEEFMGAFGQLYYGIGAGWTVVGSKDGSAAPIDLSEYSSLVAGGDCL